MTDLAAPLIDREVAEEGLSLELEDFSSDKIRVQAAGPPHRVHEELAAGRTTLRS